MVDISSDFVDHDGLDVTLRSFGNRPFRVVFEPGMGELESPSGELIRLEIRGPEETLEIAYSPGLITVWPHHNLLIRLYDADGALVDLTGSAYRTW